MISSICINCGKKQETIVVDFDGVIYKYEKGWQNGILDEEPIPDTQEALKKLNEKGFRIVLLTARLHPIYATTDFLYTNIKNDITAWLSKHGIFGGSHYHEITNNKPPAICYIDDRAIRFTTWKDISKYF